MRQAAQVPDANAEDRSGALVASPDIASVDSRRSKLSESSEKCNPIKICWPTGPLTLRARDCNCYLGS